MRKIIKHGYRYHMETTCPNCGCQFSYEWEDVITTVPSITFTTCACGCCGNNNYYTNPSYEIICPECNNKFTILNWHFSDYPVKYKLTCKK